jgi:hypothetical protein
MSSDQMARGLEMIASAAEKVDLHRGSRAVDLFRGIVRVSFEKEVQSGSRSQFRAPTFELSREFVEDFACTEGDALHCDRIQKDESGDESIFAICAQRIGSAHVVSC